MHEVKMETAAINNTLSLLLEILTQCKSKTQNYINTQNSAIWVKFEIDEKEFKAAKLAAKQFSSSLVHDIDLADMHAANIAGLICKADEAMNNELTLSLCNIFNQYAQWAKEAKGFICFADKCFADKCFAHKTELSFSSLLSASRKLHSATEHICEALNNTTNSLKK